MQILTPKPPKIYIFTVLLTDKNGNSYVLNPYTPRHDFHSMDCTDIIIGMAKGTYSRVLDYYTRDRSTPRLDTFWGGRNDITTAMGFEKDGKTTILFRKKLLGNQIVFILLIFFLNSDLLLIRNNS